MCVWEGANVSLPFLYFFPILINKITVQYVNCVMLRPLVGYIYLNKRWGLFKKERLIIWIIISENSRWSTQNQLGFLFESSRLNGVFLLKKCLLGYMFSKIRKILFFFLWSTSSLLFSVFSCKFFKFFSFYHLKTLFQTVSFFLSIKGLQT